MKRLFALLLCGAALLLTACGAGKEAEKDHYYEVLDSAGAVLYTVKDGELAETLDGLLGTSSEDMDAAGDAGDVEPLYTYAYWQERTLLAGEDPEAEREYQELIRVLVPAEGEELVIQVFPDTAALEGLNQLTRDTVDIASLLSSVVTVSPETAEMLRDPGRYAA
nr:hypothetical protein [uncultured Dysosmobacter sp.]